MTTATSNISPTDQSADLMAALADAIAYREQLVEQYERGGDRERAELEEIRRDRYGALLKAVNDHLHGTPIDVARTAEDCRLAIYALLCGIVGCTQQTPAEKRKNLATDVPTMSHAMRQIEVLQWILGDATEGATKFNELVEDCRDVADLPAALRDIKRELPSWVRDKLFAVVPY